MFDIGWAELLILAVVAIIVVGPKDLPRMLYSLGQVVAKIRRSADEFRTQFNDSMREAGMDDIQQGMKKLGDLNPAHQIRESIDEAFREPVTNPKKGPAGKADEQTGAEARDQDGWEELDAVEGKRDDAGEAGEDLDAPPPPLEPRSPETAKARDDAADDPEEPTHARAGQQSGAVS